MAKVTRNTFFTSSLGDFSVYHMEGVEKLVIRAKGGPTKEQIKNDPQFDRTRKNSSEFSGAGIASGKIMHTSHLINKAADNSFSGRLSAVCHVLQTLDTSHVHGERSILFTKNGQLLEGMNFSKLRIIDSVLKNLPAFVISRDACSASVTFTDLFPGVNLFNPWNLPKYRLLITLGVLQDLVFTSSGYAAANPEIILYRTQVVTDWQSSNDVFKSAIFKLRLADNAILDSNSSLVLSIGVEFGNRVTNLITQPVKKACCGKIVGVR